jgi:MATE family multidrug resistance protein|tara:strand:+ start:1915 stop:3231 length:1317 start_codon:yes stop_codon:yes gene_type:complete
MKYQAKISKKDLFLLSIPVFFSNLAIPLVGIVDTTLVGHLGNSLYLAAIGVATSITTMIFWSFGFLRMGTTGLVSQALGKGDYREIVLILLRSLTIAASIGLLIIFLKNPILMTLNNFYNISNETLILISKYISIRVFSAPAEMIIYVLTGFYLGLQKTKISSLLVSFFSICNILLSIYLVRFLNFNIDGVALGTVFSSYLTVFIFLVFTYFFIKEKFSIIPRYKKIFIKKKFMQLLNINFNIFVRTILLTFTFFWFTYQGSQISEDYLAINSILLQFILLSSFFLDAYAFSTEGIIGFSIGRKVKKTFLFVVNNSFQLSFFTGLIISAIFLIFFKQIINIFTDIEYLRYLSYGFIFWIILIPPIASICYQFDGIFIGASQTIEIRNSMIISVGLFLIISKYLTEYFDNHGLWFSLLVFMILRSITLRFYFSKILRKF